MADWPESRYRRAEWQPGMSITLADDQEWHFPKPRVRFQVAIGADGKPHARPMTAKHGGISFIDAFDQLNQTRNDAEYFSILSSLAIQLLRANYDLPDDAIPDLFQYEYDDPESTLMWDSLRNLVLGISPKQ